MGQSLWLDNITRTMLADGTLAGYIEELSVTGLTSNPTIFDKAISGGDAYDEQIAELAAPSGRDSTEEIFFELAIADLRDATDLFAGVHERTDRRRRLVLARGLAAARRRHRGDDRAGRRSCTPRPSATTSSSRSPAPRPAWRRSRSRSSPASRSTSRCSSTRAVPRRRRRLHEGDRAADRGRARPRRRLGRLDLHQPLGRRRRRRGARRAAQPARPRDRLPRLPRLPRAARLASAGSG